MSGVHVPGGIVRLPRMATEVVLVLLVVLLVGRMVVVVHWLIFRSHGEVRTRNLSENKGVVVWMGEG